MKSDRATILSLLRSDCLRHIVTLKMLSLYGDHVQTILSEDDGGWALMSLLPTRVSDFDRRIYPNTTLVVLMDGTSHEAKLRLLNNMPAEHMVVKTYDESVKDRLLNRFQAKPALSFVSYTALSPHASHSTPAGVCESSVPDGEITPIFGHNGYEPAELSRHFADGARWFGVRDHGRIVSACFVFRNFETVWEIGGVFTEPDHRRRGHARKVVTGALNHLLASGFSPRYQVRSDNTESIRLAETIGLKEFLRMDHYLVRTDEAVST